jgi:RNA-directed DNA polymerase
MLTTNEILEMIKRDGFRISNNKTNYSRAPIVTGIHPMNNYLKLPVSFEEKLKSESNTPETLKGLLNYEKKVDKINKNGRKSQIDKGSTI